MIITNIEAATNAKYKVYIDGEYAFILYKKELSRYHIAAGQELEEGVWQKIRTEVIGKRAKLRALHLLNDMGRTEAQLRQKLERDGYTTDVVEEAVSYVKSFGYINDENYARIFIDSKKNKKSRKEISAILLQKGVAKEVIEEAFGEYDEEDDARAAIANILEKKHYDPENADWRETRKAAAYLMRKGFEYGDIRRVMQIPEQNM